MAIDQPELEQLKATLSQLNEQIQSIGVNDGSDLTDLIALRQDLSELIALREEQLLIDRKAAVLNEIQCQLKASSDAVTGTIEEQGTPSLVGQDAQTTLTAVTDELKQAVIGQKCSIGGWTANGKFIRQNAVICDVVHEGITTSITNDTAETTSSDQKNLEIQETRVRVFLTHPTRTTDVPCAQFMSEGLCHRGIRCPWSHGKIVSNKDIGEWCEPDPELYLLEGQPCLVKEHPDSPRMSVWRHAHLLHTDIDAQTCVIQWGHTYSGDSVGGSKVKGAAESGRTILRTQRTSYDQLEATVANVPIDAVWPLATEDVDDVNSDEDIEVVSTDSDESDSDDLEEDYYNSAVNSAKQSPSITSSTPDRCSSYQPNEPDAKRHAPIHSRSKISFVPGGILNPEDVLRAIPYSDPVGAITTSEDEMKASFGSWEAHTRGIGSRLLANMGYTGRGGLGTSGHGRIIPVALLLEKFQILPHGWNKRPTLDRVLHLSSNRPLTTSSNRKHKARTDLTYDSHKSSNTSTKKPWQPHLFQFLNNVLHRSHEKLDSNTLSQTTASVQQQSSSTTSIKSSSSNEADFRVQLFRTQEDIGRTIQQMHRARQSIERNQGRDRMMTKQSENRLATLQAQLDRLRGLERTLLRSKSKQTAEKKLRIF